MKCFAIVALLFASAGVAHGQQQVGDVITEQAIGDNWREWREERQLAREDRIKAREERAQTAAKIEEAIGMLQRLFWCGFALCVLTLIAVILYLAKPVFDLVRGVLSRFGLIAAMCLLAISANAQEPTPAVNPNPASKPIKKPEESVLDRPKPTDYRTALAKYKQGRPMVVIAGAQWCAPCQKMKSELRAHIDAGVFDGHELALVDYDGEQELATKMLKNGKVSLPTIRLYWRDGEAKKTKVHVGYMGREQFQEFIRR